MQDLICYCFGYTALDIEQDISENGRSTLMERIVAEKKKGGLSMLGKEPQGPLMSCGGSPGGEHEAETKGAPGGSVLTGPHDHPELSPFGYLFRFAGRWFGFTGLYAAFSVCPFCGQAGCPVGVGIAGSVGAFLHCV